MPGDDNDTGARDKRVDDGSGSHEPRECMACRGSGTVISNLGGNPTHVPCPWCEGKGVRLAGLDAQSRWAAVPAEQAESHTA